MVRVKLSAVSDGLKIHLDLKVKFSSQRDLILFNDGFSG